MNKKEYDYIANLEVKNHVLLAVGDILNDGFQSEMKLCPKTECFTILYGYDVNRDTVHIYWDDVECKIVVFRYNEFEKTSEADLVDFLTMDHLPTKRVYPETCNAFCTKHIQRRLKSFNVYGLPFTTYNEKREAKLMHGYTVEQFENLLSASS